jgi:transposase
MRAYSMDLRQKIVSAYESGHGTFDEVADTFEVGRRTVARFVGLARSGGSLWPKPCGGGRHATLSAAALALLGEQVAPRPDATLSELSDYLRSRAGVSAHPATVCRARRRLGRPRKKKPGGRRARRSEAGRVPARGRGHRPPAAGLHRRDGLPSSHDAPLRARPARGAGAPAGAAPAWHERHVGALGLRGWVAALSFSGSVDREAFDAFVTELPVPRLRRTDVVLLGNLRLHHASQVEEAVRSARARGLWLPTYSPDFSPPENCRSKVKAVVRGEEPRTASDLDAAMTRALSSVTTADVDGWFRHCGY